MREIRMLRAMWRELETELRDGLRHRHEAKAAGNSYSPNLRPPRQFSTLLAGGPAETWTMVDAKRARKAETPKQPSFYLRSRAPYFYPTNSSTLHSPWHAPDLDHDHVFRLSPLI